MFSQTNESNNGNGRVTEFPVAWRAYRNETLALHVEVLFPEVIRLLKISGTSPDILVDAGCGDGSLTAEAARTLKPRRVIAINNDADLLREARVSHLCLETVQSDLRTGLKLPFLVEAMICCNVLMHFSPVEMEHFLKSASMHLQPTGHLVVVVTHSDWVKKSCGTGPNATSPVSIQKDWNGISVLQTYYTKEGYEKLFETAGLKIVERSELSIQNLPGLASRYAENVGTPIYDVYLLSRLNSSHADNEEATIASEIGSVFEPSIDLMSGTCLPSIPALSDSGMTQTNIDTLMRMIMEREDDNEIYRVEADRLRKALETLPRLQREVLGLRYGLNDGFNYTPSEVGEIFNVTPARVRQVEAKAIRKLRSPDCLQILFPL